VPKKAVMTVDSPVVRAPILRRLLRFLPDSLDIGPPAVDGVSDPTGPRTVQIVVAASGIVIHLGMYFLVGRNAFLWVALIAAAYLATVPFTGRLADISPAVATWWDLVALVAGASLLGDPVFLIAWFPLVIIANLFYLPSALAIRNSLSMVVVAAGYSIVMIAMSDRLFDAATMRTYLTATLFMWACAAVVYAFAVGGAVNRRESVITEALGQRDAAEARARAEASRLRVVLEEAPIGLLVQGGDGAFMYGNAPALEMLDLTLDELLASGTVSAMDPATRGEVEAEIINARIAGKPFRSEFRTLAGRILELRGRHVDLDGSFTTITTLRDLTPEREAHRHIERLRTLVEHSATHMVVFDDRGAVVVANRVFREFWTKGSPVAGRSVLDIVGEQMRPFVEMRRLDSERMYERELTAPNGEKLWIAMSVADFRDPFDGTWLRAVSARDLTEVARARRQLEELVASKDQFIASVSHELRTPLTVVVGLAAELAADAVRWSPDEITEFASLIAGQANEVASLVEDLLTMARADAGVLSVNLESVDLRSVVESVSSGLPVELANRVWLRPGLSSVVSADPVRLRQILRNLIINAGRYGGQAIEVDVQPGAVLVCDDGPAVPQDERERMFQAYERVHQQSGTPDSVGLGLTVCRRLSRLMGGDVVYDHDGSWSTFTVSLPES
jgi:PAS domain S-box-containing protein